MKPKLKVTKSQKVKNKQTKKKHILKDLSKRFLAYQIHSILSVQDISNKMKPMRYIHLYLNMLLCLL